MRVRPIGAKRVLACLLAGAVALASAAPPVRAAPAEGGPTPSAPPRCPGEPVSGEVAAVDGTALRLRDGTVLRIADIRLAPARAGEQARNWLASLVGRAVAGRAAGPDRWDRRAASELALAGEGPPIGLADLLVAEGFALVDPGEADALCDPALLATEAGARAAHRGYWREAAPLDANDPAAASARVGGFAIASGQIVSVGERPARTYLNFGRFGTEALTVTLPKRVWAELRRRGLSAETLRGQRVTVRGLVERRRTPVMELVVPDMLQVARDRPPAR